MLDLYKHCVPRKTDTRKWRMRACSTYTNTVFLGKSTYTNTVFLVKPTRGIGECEHARPIQTLCSSQNRHEEMENASMLDLYKHCVPRKIDLYKHCVPRKTDTRNWRMRACSTYTNTVFL